jgi:peroxiredoxin
MRSLLLVLSLVAGIATASAAPSGVVRLAPDFSFPGVGNKAKSLKSLRGQPVVLIIAQSPKNGDFKKEVKFLREIYQQFASKQVVFVAAFTGEADGLKSDIPFAVANNGAAVASAYGLTDKDKFNIVIIGKDGNLDYQTNKVLPPERVRDVIQNSYAVQANTGR